MTIPEKNVVEVTREINGTVNDVIALLEMPDDVANWNPLLDNVRLREGTTQERDSVLDWEANVLGVPLKGHSVVTTWEPGREYAWRNTEDRLGLSNEGRFVLRQTDGGVRITASVTIELPNGIIGLLDITGVRGFLERAINNAIGRMDQTISARRGEGKPTE